MRKWLKKAAGSILTVITAMSLITFKTPGIMVRAEIQGESEDITGGYLEMSWDNDVPAVNTGLSYSDAREMLVDDSIALDKGRISGEYDETIPGAWPYGYTDTDNLIDYFETRLTPLRNQGSEGTCWAHSALSLIEQYLLFNDGSDSKGKVSRNAVGTIPAVDYSELHLAYNYYHNGINPIIPDQDGDYVTFYLEEGDTFLSNGGNLMLAAETLIKWRGIVDERLVPYEKTADFVTDEQLRAENGLPETLAYKEDQVHLTSAYTINIHANQNQVKQAIIENGSVGSSFYYSPEFYDSEHNALYNYVNYCTNHAVNIVGWDDEFPAEYFAAGTGRPSKNGAWLVRNSWASGNSVLGSELLDVRGYFWISYEDESLTDAAYVFETGKSDEYDNNYYYTNQVYSTGCYTYQKTANSFVLNGEHEAERESIDAVVIQTDDAEVNYSISIYSVDENGRPLEPIKENYEPTTGTIVYPGIYTIPLIDKVVLDRGAKFAIVVETDNGYICAEYSWKSPGYRMTVKANKGESYCFNGYKWVDFSDVSSALFGNFCIQALTSNVGMKNAGAVQGMKAAERNMDSITVQWEPLEDADGYSVYRVTDVFDEDEMVKISDGITGTEYTDNNLKENSECFYRVVPLINGSEDFKRSSKILITAVKTADRPEITATVTASDMIFYEGDVLRQMIYGKCGNGAAGVEVKYKASAGTGEWSEVPVRYFYEDNIKKWKFYGDDILPGKCTISVIPFFENTYGERGYGSSIEKVIQARYSSPGNVTAEYDASKGCVNVSWDKVNGATGYTVIRKLKGLSSGVKVLGTVSDLHIEDKTAKPGTSYTYLIYAYNSKISGQCQDYSLYGEASITVPGKKTLLSSDFYSWDDEGCTYDGLEHESTIEIMDSITDAGNITVFYKAEGTDIWTTDKPVNSGKYTVAIDAAESDTYYAVSKLTAENWNFEIYPAELIVIADEDLQKEVGDEDPVLVYTYSGNVEGEVPGFTGSLTRDPGEAMGEYAIRQGTLQLADNGNFLASNYIMEFYEDYSYLNIYGVDFDKPVITVISKDKHSVKFEWEPVRKAEGYRIYDAKEGYFIGKTEDLSFEIEDLEADTDYEFRVYPYGCGMDVDAVVSPYGMLTVSTDPLDILTSEDFYISSCEVVYDGLEHEAELHTRSDNIRIAKILYADEEHPDEWKEDLPINVGKYYVAVTTERTDDYEEALLLTDPSWVFIIKNAEIESEIVPGDIDGDGVINAKDVTMLRRYLAGGWNVTVNLANADVDGDGTINAKDVTILRRYLAGGWGVVLGKQ